jgi:hypothetical protein
MDLYEIGKGHFIDMYQLEIIFDVSRSDFFT